MPPQVAVVFGSGLGPATQRVRPQLVLPFDDVPGLVAPAAGNHRGLVTLADWAGKRVLLFEGRLHYYEGHAWRQVEQAVRLAVEFGVRVILLTNAAGGIHDALVPGCFMLIRDHIEWNRPCCWRQPGPGGLGGPRPAPYSSRLGAVLQQAAERVGMQLHEGIYAAVTGPNFETPAEIRALRSCGADAVGMSTTREASCAAALRAECAALSCITNRAAGLSTGPITNEEVLVTAGAQCEHLADLIEAFLRMLPAEPQEPRSR